MGFVRVGVLRDSLSISDFSNPFHWDIWIAKDYGIKESWSKEFVIGNVIGMRGYGDYYETIMILKNSEILMHFNKGVLVLYSPKEGRVEKLNIDGININPAFCGTAHIPSFVSLKDVAKGESLKLRRSYFGQVKKARLAVSYFDYHSLFMDLKYGEV
ncbi:unnamed protein product [Camellia sinensis]